MVRKSHKWRKRFLCGHRGYGRWCHRCAVSRRRSLPKSRQRNRSRPRIAARFRALAQRQAEKQQWQQQFLNDPIPLAHLPKPVVIKTRLILAALEQGTSPTELRGKRFQFDRTLLSIPVGYRYRLLCRWRRITALPMAEGGITPLGVMSHEAYNAIARNKKRVNGA